ncbi:hypothetical protein [Actinomycetospora flava]|uniref:Uncharacterized protein n=1 Tax=Actinomycetospora flava TaxID=3129232 RepID=A0ABU8MCH8_9PSEU
MLEQDHSPAGRALRSAREALANADRVVERAQLAQAAARSARTSRAPRTVDAETEAVLRARLTRPDPT